MALATSQDVVDRLGRLLSTEETTRVTGLLDEASVMVEGWLRCVPDPIPDAVKIVVSRMVARVLATSGAGPGPGVTGMQGAMGPFQMNRTYSPDATSGGVWLTRQDKTMLRPYGCRGRAGNVGVSKW